MSTQNTCFMKNGSIYKVTTKEDLDLHDLLPAGNYVVCMDAFEQFQLKKVDDFVHNTKLYGNTTRHADRILNTFIDRPSSTGVMLTGEKGSGKTLLSREVSIKAAALGYPTIIINAPWRGDKFNTFMQNIDQPCIVLFDEFEKVYAREDQEQILTLLDGVFSSKKLFMLTCNDKWRVDCNMRNRPGRIFYMIDFKGLDEAFIREYCEDNLNNKTQIDNVCTMALMFDQFNFDMLKAVVEDMNRYNESPSEVMQLLNTKPEFSQNQAFNIKLYDNGTLISPSLYEDKFWHGNPLEANQVRFEYQDINDLDEDGDATWVRLLFTSAQLSKIDPARGVFVYENDDHQKVELSRAAQYKHDYSKFF